MSQVNLQQNPLDELQKIAVGFLLVALGFGLVQSLILIPAAIGLTYIYKRSVFYFMMTLVFIVLGIMYFVELVGSPILIYKAWGEALATLIMDPLYNGGMSLRWAHFWYNFIQMSWAWSPLAAVVIAYRILKHTKIGTLMKFDAKKPVIKRSAFEKHRGRTDQVLIGINAETKKPVFLENEERLRHTQVLGATGFGKTESVLLPLMRHDIMTGKGLMVIDAKADEKLLKQIVSLAKDYGRVKDIKYFSPTRPENSWTYNPFDGDDQTVVSEKLISALDWSEQFYKKVSQHAVLAIAHTLILAKQPVTVHSLLEGLKNPQGLLIHGVTNSALKYLLEHHKKSRDHYAGLITDLENLVSTSFGPLMVNSPASIDLLKAYSNNHIVIFQASSLQFPETARAFGKLLLRDIMCLVSKIYTEVPASRRKFFPVYIDEFGSFAIPAFAECMRMMRASGVNATILHQSLGDLDALGTYFKQQVMGNTNVKLIMKVGDNETVEETARMTGTKTVKVTTHQVNLGLFDTNEKTGLGSETLAEAFNIHPNTIRQLGVGEAVMMSGLTHRTARLKLDYLSFPSLQNILIPVRPNIQDKTVQDRPIERLLGADRRRDILGSDDETLN